MATQPKNGAIELALNDDRDSSGQKARPQLEAATTPLAPDPFEPAEIGLLIHHRKCTAEYLGLNGEWVILLDDGRTEYIHMGSLLRPAVLFFTGFLHSLLGPAVYQQPLKLSSGRSGSTDTDRMGRAATFPRAARYFGNPKLVDEAELTG